MVRQDEKREGETLFGKERERGQNGQGEPVQTLKREKKRAARFFLSGGGNWPTGGKRIRRGAKVQMGFLLTRAKKEENM